MDRLATMCYVSSNLESIYAQYLGGPGLMVPWCHGRSKVSKRSSISSFFCRNSSGHWLKEVWWAKNIGTGNMGRLRNITEMSGALANGGFVTLVHPNNHWPGWRAAISCTTCVHSKVAQLEGQDRDAGVMVTLDLPATQALRGTPTSLSQMGCWDLHRSCPSSSSCQFHISSMPGLWVIAG